MYSLLVLASLLGAGKPWDPQPGKGDPAGRSPLVPERAVPGLALSLPIEISEGRALRRRVRKAGYLLGGGGAAGGGRRLGAWLPRGWGRACMRGGRGRGSSVSLTA